MCFINLLQNVFVPNLDMYFINIFRSSSYCLFLLSPVLILHTGQNVTDVPLIINAEDWIATWKSLEDKREVF